MAAIIRSKLNYVSDKLTTIVIFPTHDLAISELTHTDKQAVTDHEFSSVYMCTVSHHMIVCTMQNQWWLTPHKTRYIVHAHSHGNDITDFTKNWTIQNLGIWF